MESELAFFNGVKQGMAISGTLAFIILIAATKNIFISIYAMKSVVFTVSSVVAVMVLKDW